MIRVYTRQLNLLVETSSYQSLQFTRDFHGISNFEIHINKHLQGAEHFNKGNVIALNGYKAGVILTKEITLDENGKGSENIVVSGYTLDGLMSRRVTVPPEHTSHDRKTANAETVMKHYVENHFFNPADNNRRLPNFHIAPNMNRGVKIEWESRYRNVADELEKISIESGLGWHIYINFETSQYIFDVFEKRDLTQGNLSGLNPVIFSPDFGTVKSQSLLDSDNELKNFAYVGGQGEGVERKFIKIGEKTGWDRLESFVDARDVSDELEDEDKQYDEEGELIEETLTDAEVEALLLKRGNEKLSEMETILSFEAEILTPVTRKSYSYSHDGFLQPTQVIGQSYTPKSQTITPFEYEVDFDLGDIVSVVNHSWGVDLATPIVKLIEIHESSGFRLEATFGDNVPTITKKLKQKFDDLEDVEKDEAVYKYIKNEKEDTIKELTPQKKALWEGVYLLNEKQTINPNKKLDECVGGWVLRWEYYQAGVAQNSSLYYQYIPKNLIIENQGVSHRFVMVLGPNTLVKMMFIYNNRITGHASNANSPESSSVITAVYEY